MARFEYRNGDVHLCADKGEEITPEMVAAWAAVEQITALNNIAIAFSDLGQLLADAISEFGEKQASDR